MTLHEVKPTLYSGTSNLYTGMLPPDEATDNLFRAFALALRNSATLYTGTLCHDSDGAELLHPYIIVENEQKFLDRLYHNEKGQPGGHVYEVVSDSFSYVRDDNGQVKWLSPVSAEIKRTWFTPLHETMRGVQIFAVTDPDFVQALNQSANHMKILEQGLGYGSIEWLNQSRKYGVIPIDFFSERRQPDTVEIRMSYGD